MKRREEGYIEDLGGPEVELSRTCAVISQVVRKGTFTLEKALDAYEVSMEDYVNFMAKEMASHFSEEVDCIFSYQSSDKNTVHIKIGFLAALQEKLVPIYSEKPYISKFFKNLEIDALSAIK